VNQLKAASGQFQTVTVVTEISGKRSFACVFRRSVTDRFGIVTAEFGSVTGDFGDVTDGRLVAA
jgi:hypothetical protein